MQFVAREVRDIGRFIRARREATSASDFTELPQRRRHVLHLTQGDLAELAHVSTVVISQIEQGKYPNLAHGILQRIATALRMTPQQQQYLFGLQDPRPALQHATEPAPDWVTTSTNLTQHPAIVVNPAYDILAINQKALDLFGSFRPEFSAQRNGAISIFSLPGIRTFIEDWEAYAASFVSGLKISYAIFPSYRDHLDDLAHRLREKEKLFGELWDQDDPLVKPTMEKTFHHSELGELYMLQILTDIVEAPNLTRVEFLPANDETAAKLQRL